MEARLPPPKKKSEQYFSGKYYVKFGHFINFSYTSSGNRNEMPVSGSDSYALLFLVHYSPMPASFSVVTVIQSRPVFTAVASILGECLFAHSMF